MVADDLVEPAAPQPLPRVLGAWDGTAIVVGSIIGSGIFLKVGNVDKELGGWGFGSIIGVWIVVGIVTLCGSLALAELAAMYPHAGGPYVYLREAYGRLLAFLWGWSEFWVMRTGAMGALACASALYLYQVVTISHWQQAAFAVSVIVVLTAANVASTRWAANIQNVLTAIKVSFLVAIIALPVLLGIAQFEHWQPLLRSGGDGSLAAALGAALMAVMWPYHGWITVAPVAEDIRNPQRNVPRALTWGLLIVIAAYVGANLSYHLVLTIEQIAGTKTIASDVCRVFFGPAGTTLAAACVMCSTMGAANSDIISGPRIYLAMARDRLFPAWMHHLHATRQTPANAIIVQSAWTVALIVLFYSWKDNPKAAFDGLTDSVIVAGLIFFSLTVGAVYVLRITRPDLPRPYRTWGYPVTPALMIAVYAFALYRQLIDQFGQTVYVLGLIGAGVVYYVVIGGWKREVVALPVVALPEETA